MMIGKRALPALAVIVLLATHGVSRTRDLAEAESALVANRFRDAAAALAEIADDEATSGDVRARALRGLAVARFARHECAAGVTAIERAVLADPEYPGNVGLLAIAERFVVGELGPEGHWADQLETLAGAAEGHPSLAGRVLRLQQLDRKLRGLYDEYDAHHGDPQAIRDFYLIGPFPNVGGSGLDKPFPPEHGIDFSAAYAGRRGGPVRWFRYRARPGGFLDLDSIFGSVPEAVMYAVTHVRPTAGTRAVLHVSGSGAFRAWVNGCLVLDEPEVRTSPEPLYEVPVELEEGWNRVLLKTGAETERLYVHVRITDADGRPLRIEVDAAGEAYARSEVQPTGGQLETVPRGLERYPDDSWLRRWMESLQGAPLADRLLFIRFLTHRQFIDEAEEALDAAEGEFGNRALLDELRCGLLEKMERSGEAATLWRAIHDEAPELLSARVALLAELFSQGDTEQAWAELENAIAELESDPYLKAIHGALLTSRGSVREGMSEIEDAFRVAPGNGAVRDLYLTMLRTAGRETVYEQTLLQSVGVRQDDCDLARLAAATFFDRKEYDRALQLLEQAQRAGARDDVVHMEMATVLEAADRLDESIDVLKEGLVRSPMNARLYEMLGSALMKAGRSEEALEFLKRQLELDPGAFAARDVIRRIEGKPPLQDLFPKVDVAELSAADLSWVGPDAKAVRLLDSVEVIEHPDGATERRHHIVTKLLTEGGVETFRQTNIPVFGSGSDGRVEIARTIKPDGREVAAESVYGQVTFADVEPGDIVELRYVNRYTSGIGLPNEFWHQHFFQFSVPCLLSRFSILLPTDRQYDFALHNMDISPEVSYHGEWRLDTWEARRTPPYAVETDMPPPEEQAAWLDISTVRSWERIAHWFDDISRGRLRAPRAAKDLAVDLAAGAPDDSTKIASVAHYVFKNIQYEGGPFVESAHVPRSIEEVLRTRFGDCKDQSALVVALLREMGLEARFALVNDRSEMTVPYLPSPRFTHVIVQARSGEGRTYWVDPTFKGLSFPNVPVYLEGAQALLVDPENPEFVTIGIDPPRTNGNVSVIDAAIDDDGTLYASGTCRFVGEDAAGYRWILKFFPEMKEHVVGNLIASEHPAADLTEFSVQESGDLDRPFELSYRFEQPGAASLAGSLMIVEVPWTVGKVPHELVALEERQHPLVLNSWKGRYSESIALRLPEGYEPLDKLESVELACTVGRFTLNRTLSEDGAIHLDKVLELSAVRVEPEEYQAFRAFLRDAWRAEEQQLVAHRAGR